jgi:hypothetical protein
MHRLGPNVDIARSLVILGETVQTRGDLAAARRILDEAVAVSRTPGATVELVDALHYLGGDALAVGEYNRARAYGVEGLVLARQVSYRRGVARALGELGSISYIEHDRGVNDRWETAQASAISRPTRAFSRPPPHFSCARSSLATNSVIKRSSARFSKVLLTWPRPKASPSGRCAWPGRPRPSASSNRPRRILRARRAHVARGGCSPGDRWCVRKAEYAG